MSYATLPVLFALAPVGWAAGGGGADGVGADGGGEAPPLVRLTVQSADDLYELLEGRVRVEAVDGGLLFETRGGRIRSVLPGEIVAREPTGDPFTPLPADELGRELRGEVAAAGGRAEVAVTGHFVLASTADAAFTRWAGDLLERVHRQTLAAWEKQGLPVTEPPGKLPVIVLADRAQFERFAATVDGVDPAVSQGFYSPQTNRVVLYDFAGGTPAPRGRADRARVIAQRQQNVATVVHEATHQLAYNAGLHTRFADNPVWLTEGLAMYAETPVRGSARGWAGPGKINPVRLRQFRAFAERAGGTNPLPALLGTDDASRDPATVLDAYAASWALVYFLSEERTDAFAAYLKTIAAKRPLMFGTPDERLAEFRAAFGDDLDALWAALRNDMRRRR